MILTGINSIYKGDDNDAVVCTVLFFYLSALISYEIPETENSLEAKLEFVTLDYVINKLFRVISP